MENIALKHIKLYKMDDFFYKNIYLNFKKIITEKYIKVLEILQYFCVMTLQSGEKQCFFFPLSGNKLMLPHE